MTTDLELDGWRQRWQRQPARLAAPELKESVLRETRRSKLMLLAPVAVTVIFGGGALLGALNAPNPATTALALGVWAYLALAWAGALWIARGTWRPSADSAAAFLQLAIRRCESGLASVPFAIALYASELVFVFIWSVRTGVGTASAVLASPSMVLIGWVGGPVFVALMMGYWRRKRRELARLQEMQQQLGQD